MFGAAVTDRECDAVSSYPIAFREKGVEEQIDELRSAFDLPLSTDGMRKAIELEQAPIPSGAESWGAIVHPRAFGSYPEAMHRVTRALDQLGRFRNLIGTKLDHTHIRMGERQVRFLDQVEEYQNESILVLPVQFGARYRDCPPEVVGQRIEHTVHEFAFGAFVSGCLLITHPELFYVDEFRALEGCGDQFRTGKHLPWGETPYWFIDDRVKLAARLATGSRRGTFAPSGWRSW